MRTNHNDQYWLDLINQCRTSGFTDRQWCIDNGIPVSTFYYHIRLLRERACEIPAVTGRKEQHQEVVPLSFVDESTFIHTEPGRATAVRISLHGISIEVLNGADESVIANTLRALQKLC